MRPSYWCDRHCDGHEFPKSSDIWLVRIERLDVDMRPEEVTAFRVHTPSQAEAEQIGEQMREQWMLRHPGEPTTMFVSKVR